MPKKLGTNPKADAARERKADKKREDKERNEKQVEDSKWVDDDRQNASKQQRKENKEKKRLEDLQRKQEARAMLTEEDSKHKSKPNPSSSSSKVTRAQIAEEKQRQAHLEKKSLKEKTKAEEDDIFTEENPNRKMAELLAADGATEARSVEEAIETLNVGQTSSVDKNPEKRMKAAYNAFEAERLPILKAENPNLRMSQLKQLLRKEWLKSPDNPLNQMLR